MVEPRPSPTASQYANTPRRRRILDGLRFLGDGPAGFYLDALRILASPQELITASHLVAHCLREVESSTREAYLPIGYVPDDTPGEHLRQVDAVIEELGVAPDGPLASLWRLVVRKQALPGRAHRRNLLPARELDTEALEFVEQMETLFDGILIASETRYVALIPKLESLASKAQPAKADLAFVEKRMPRNPVTLGHFFGALHEPRWLLPLSKRGLFSMPPNLVPQEDGRVLVPPWPEGRYLAEMAAVEPKAVLKIVRSLPETDNPRVYEGVANIAAVLSAGMAVELVPMLKKGLALPAQLLLPQTATDVICHLAQGGEASQALDLCKDLFRILPPPSDGSGQLGPGGAPSIMSEWAYGRAVAKVQSCLGAADRLATLQLFAGLLDAAVEVSRPATRPGRDYSETWRDEISSEEDEHMDIKNLLVSAVTRSAKDADADLRDAVAAQLDGGRWPVFRRVTLEICRHIGDTTWAAKLLVRKELFEDWSPEYQKLVRAKFPSLPKAAQDKILRMIQAGPPAKRVETFLRGANDVAPSPAEVAKWTDGWREGRLEVMGHPLPPRWKGRLWEPSASRRARKLVYGPQRLFRSGTLVGPNPVDVSRMDRAGLISYLRTLGSSDPWGGRGTADVSTLIRQQVGEDPAWLGTLNDDFADVSRTMIEAIVGGYAVAYDQGRALPWPQIIESCIWVISRSFRDHIDPEGQQRQENWGFTRRSVLWLLEKGFRNSEQSIPISERSRVWTIFQLLDNDAATTPDEDAWASDDTPGVGSLNTVAGTIVSTAIDYGRWVDQHTGGIDGLGSLPELRALLESRLAAGVKRQPVVGEAFGRYLPVLWHMDSDWTTANIPRIFEASVAGTTAWRNFLVFRGAAPWIFPHIRYLYEQSLQELPGDDAEQSRSTAWVGDLAEHLIVYRAWAGLEQQEGNLLDAFFAVAPGDLRRHALEFPGFLLTPPKEETPPEGTVERLMKVWEQRVNHQRSASREDASVEMKAFGYWFTSEAFPLEWSLEHLVEALELGGQVENEHGVVTRLASLEDQYLGHAVRALTLMSAVDDDPWRVLGWGGDGHRILRRGRDSHDQRVREEATTLVSRLLRRGYDTLKDLADTE